MAVGPLPGLRLLRPGVTAEAKEAGWPQAQVELWKIFRGLFVTISSLPGQILATAQAPCRFEESDPGTQKPPQAPRLFLELLSVKDAIFRELVDRYSL